MKKHIRLIDVAQMAKVSVATASMAMADHPDINDDTKHRIRILGRKLGYQRPVDRALRRNKKQMSKGARFGFMSVGTRLSDEVLTDFLHELSIRAVSAEARLEVCSVQDVDDAETLASYVLDFARQLDGLIIQGLVSRHLLEKLKQEHIACVVFGNTLNDSNEDFSSFSKMPSMSGIGHTIGADEIKMGRLATSCLISAGHRRVGFVCEKVYPGLWAHNWLGGYRLAHFDAGLVCDDGLVHVAGKTFVGGKPAASAFTAMKNPPTAWVVTDVRVAASFIQAMSERDVGIDNGSIIIGGQPSIAIKYHLEDYPLITHDTVLCARAAIERLAQLADSPVSYSTVLHIPFTTRNLPDPHTK